MTRQIIFIVFFTFLSINFATAQKYDLAAGIRWGNEFGLTFAERIHDKVTLEQNLIAQNEYSNYSLMLLGRYHKSLITSRFNLFLGGGIDIIRLKGNNDVESKTTFGPVLQGGLELTISRFVIGASLEPVFYNGLDDYQFSFDKVMSVKYVIIKKKTKMKRKFNDIFKSKKKK